MNPICTVRLHEMHIGWRFEKKEPSVYAGCRI